jgi:hypothetical protein
MQPCFALYEILIYYIIIIRKVIFIYIILGDTHILIHSQGSGLGGFGEIVIYLIPFSLQMGIPARVHWLKHSSILTLVGVVINLCRGNFLLQGQFVLFTLFMTF